VTLEAGEQNQMGDVHYEQGNYNEAVKLFEKATELEPNNGQFWMNRGHALRKLENFEEAVKCYNRVAELEPKNAMAYGFAGMVFNLQGKHDKCLEHIEKALSLEPDNSNLKNAKISALANIELARLAGRVSKISEYLNDIASSMNGIDESTLNRLEELFNMVNEAKDSFTAQPPKNHQNNYYEIMGLSKQATHEDIKKRFRELCLKVHPDKEPSALIQQTMLGIIEAYETLKDVKKREMYDATL
jgi:tetratricopeptide (TPR) repeat protein